MFIGHFGVGFGAKAAAPRVSLGTLFIAAQFIDLLWPTLLQIGAEQVRIAPGASGVTPLAFEHYPWSHSLLMTLVWGGLLAAAYLGLRRDWRGALVVGLLVPSHWLLDLVVHVPDLPLYPGSSQRFGLGLWHSLPWTLVVETTLFVAGVALYARRTQAADRIGHWAFWGLVAFLAVIQVGNMFGDPPPSVTVLAWVGQAQWLLVLWGYWVDRHRTGR
jgi:membrane-bound metal-dependent hydrolase YbcI (DUF457 family)